MNSFSFKHEQKAFADFVLKGRNMIFINLDFNQSSFDAFVEERKLERWVWVANDHRYILSYPEDVDVFSFGLLKANQDSLKVEINLGNLTEPCKRHFNSYLAQYISKVVQRNSSVTDNVLNTSEGHICHSKLEIDCWKQKVSDYSAVKLGYSFWCYTDNNTAVIVEKSYVNYIVVFIIFFTYCFYPLAIEMAFFIEDRKTVQGSYYMSESPYSPSVFCKRILFSGNNKYMAALRIILLLIALTTGIYYIKSDVHDRCNCSLKSSNDEKSFQHAENIYINYPRYIVWGAFQFLLVNICVLVNANGDLDDFLIFDITNARNFGTVLKTVQVSVFLSRNENQIQHDQAEQHHRQSHDGQGQKDHIEEDQVKDQSQTQNDLEQQRCQEGEGQQNQIEQQLEDQSQGQQQKSKRAKHLVSLKIRKMFLILSYSFWSKVFFINSLSNENRSDYNKWALLQTLLCFPVNVALVLCSTFCPVVFTVYVFVIKYIMVFFGNIFYECLSCKKNRVEKGEKKWIRFVLKSVSHCLTLIYFFILTSAPLIYFFMV